MPRRYVRSAVDVFQRMDVPLLEFPTGEGPPLYLSVSGGHWSRLGLGEGALVPLDGGRGGAFAWGLVQSRAVVWVRPGAAAAAYCHHAGPGPLDPRVATRALWELECEPPDRGEVYAVVASRSTVTAADEAFLEAQGLRADRIFSYSNALRPQFGVSATGCVGEAS